MPDEANETDEEFMSRAHDNVLAMLRGKVDPETYTFLQLLMQIGNENEVLCSDLTPRFITWLRNNPHRVPEKCSLVMLDHLKDCSLCRGRIQQTGLSKGWLEPPKPSDPGLAQWPKGVWAAVEQGKKATQVEQEASHE